MTDLETCEARAAEARNDAQQAKLDNVRERCLRAAAAWEEMAERIRRTERMRATLTQEKERLAKGSQSAPAPWPANLETTKSKTNEHEIHESSRS